MKNMYESHFLGVTSSHTSPWGWKSKASSVGAPFAPSVWAPEDVEKLRAFQIIPGFIQERLGLADGALEPGKFGYHDIIYIYIYIYIYI